MRETENPWRELPTPTGKGSATGRRVNSAGIYNFFWGRDVDGNPLLILNHGSGRIARPLPRLYGLEVRHENEGGEQHQSLVWALKHPEHAELFHELCLDVIRVAERTSSEGAAVSSAIGRTWRWHNLLRGGGSGRLSLQRQMGLIAELLVLEDVVIPRIGSAAAIRSWRGPLDAPQDFQYLKVAIEVKATTESSGQMVRISSEFQLDSAELDVLWLAVATLKQCDGDGGEGAFTLDSLVAQAIEAVQGDSASGQLLSGLLMAAGYDEQDDYPEPSWSLGQLDFYRAGTDFPAITPPDLPLGVTGVRYSLRLAECAVHHHDRAAVDATLLGAADGGH